MFKAHNIILTPASFDYCSSLPLNMDYGFLTLEYWMPILNEKILKILVYLYCLPGCKGPLQGTVASYLSPHASLPTVSVIMPVMSLKSTSRRFRLDGLLVTVATR